MTGAVRARAPPVVDFEFLLGQYTGNAVVDRLLCVAERAEEDEVAREALAHAKRALEGKVDEFSLKPVTSNGAAYERAMTIATTRGVPTSTVAFTASGRRRTRRGRMQNWNDSRPISPTCARNASKKI